MKLAPSSNLALAVIALSPSLLSSPVFAAPVPDIGGVRSPDPNAGGFIDSPHLQTTDLPLIRATSTSGETPVVTIGVTPAAMIAGRRRSVGRRKSVGLRTNNGSPDPSLGTSAGSNAVPTPAMTLLPTSATSSVATGSTSVLIEPDGSVHEPSSRPSDASKGNDEHSEMRTQHETYKPTHSHQLQHDAQNDPLSSEARSLNLDSLVPRDTSSIPGVVSSAPSFSYVPAWGSSGLANSYAPLEGQMHNSDVQYLPYDLGVYQTVPAIYGYGLGPSYTPIGDRVGAVEQGLNGVNRVSGTTLSSLSGIEHIPSAGVIAGATVWKAGYLGKEAKNSVRPGSAVSLPSFVPAGGLPYLSGVGVPNLPSVVLPSVPDTGALAGSKTGLQAIPGFDPLPVPAPNTTPIQVEPLKAWPSDVSNSFSIIPELAPISASVAPSVHSLAAASISPISTAAFSTVTFTQAPRPSLLSNPSPPSYDLKDADSLVVSRTITARPSTTDSVPETSSGLSSASLTSVLPVLTSTPDA